MPSSPTFSDELADDTVQRYYYIYDSRESRTLVMDRTTGEEFLWENDARTPLLEYVAATCSDDALRAFAVWCARRVMPTDGEDDSSAVPDLDGEAETNDRPARRLLRVAEQMAGASTADPSDAGEAPDPEQVRADTVNDVVRAATIGLSRMDPTAARLLTAQSATHPNARRAALDAAHMAERYAEFVAFRRRETLTAASLAPTGLDAETLEPDAAARRMRQQQIDRLLDQL